MWSAPGYLVDTTGNRETLKAMETSLIIKVAFAKFENALGSLVHGLIGWRAIIGYLIIKNKCVIRSVRGIWQVQQRDTGEVD